MARQNHDHETAVRLGGSDCGAAAGMWITSNVDGCLHRTTDGLPKIRTAVEPVCAGMVILFGTTTGVIPAVAPGTVQLDWTRATPPGDVMPALPATADSIRELRRFTGLTWDELGRLFGVSRRAVHNWATGGALNAKNGELLSTLVSYLKTYDTGDPRKTRAALLAPSGGDRSEFERIVALSRPDSNRSRGGLRPAQLLDVREDPPAISGRLLDVELYPEEIRDQ